MPATPEPQLTATEKAKAAWLIARMGKRAIAGPDVYQEDLEKKLDRLMETARLREAKAKTPR
ncbi:MULTISPECIES: DUF6257 family protein [Streptomyces]|uniref:DUF3072 domain-containing protein n=1 Tax=Streptomyces rutgersensis TaxID=53451 RepID=A0ABX6RQH2_9ACTN|nr:MULTISPECIES: DUF6257 family protein [Streptomyces]MBL3805591.1 hypothetical protein [Streptomyces sp. BRB081]PJM81831.1 hypothetical protein CH313_21045 [Streptomyces sp. TSRI0384-2]QNE82730.1 hypothetical protein F0345_17755 [Streptomyces rutgersensis]